MFGLVGFGFSLWSGSFHVTSAEKFHGTVHLDCSRYCTSGLFTPLQLDWMLSAIFDPTGLPYQLDWMLSAFSGLYWMLSAPTGLPVQLLQLDCFSCCLWFASQLLFLPKLYWLSAAVCDSCFNWTACSAASVGLFWVSTSIYFVRLLIGLKNLRKGRTNDLESYQML